MHRVPKRPWQIPAGENCLLQAMRPFCKHVAPLRVFPPLQCGGWRGGRLCPGETETVCSGPVKQEDSTFLNCPQESIAWEGWGNLFLQDFQHILDKKDMLWWAQHMCLTQASSKTTLDHLNRCPKSPEPTHQNMFFQYKLICERNNGWQLARKSLKRNMLKYITEYWHAKSINIPHYVMVCAVDSHGTLVTCILSTWIYTWTHTYFIIGASSNTPWRATWCKPYFWYIKK